METIELHGLTFGGERLHDHDANFSWNETDILGVATDWTRREKRPGERVINTGRVGKRFYDFAAAVRKGRAEGMKGPQAAEHAAREYQWLKDYCDDKWHYIGVHVVLLDAEGKQTIFYNALWGIESDADGLLATWRRISVLASTGRISSSFPPTPCTSAHRRWPREGRPVVPPRFILDRRPLVPLQPTLVRQPRALRHRLDRSARR